MSKIIDVMKDERLSIESKAIYSYMRSYYDECENKNDFTVGFRDIFKDLQISENRFYRHMKGLIECGYIEKKRTIGERNLLGVNVYKFPEPNNNTKWFIKLHDREGYIYFIKSKNSGLIKIGHAKNIENRIKHLQVGNHEELILLASTKGSINDEFLLHEKFKEYRVRGEWFEPSKGIEEMILSLN